MIKGLIHQRNVRMEQGHSYLKTKQQQKNLHGVSNVNAWSRTTVF